MRLSLLLGCASAMLSCGGREPTTVEIRNDAATAFFNLTYTIAESRAQVIAAGDLIPAATTRTYPYAILDGEEGDALSMIFGVGSLPGDSAFQPLDAEMRDGGRLTITYTRDPNASQGTASIAWR